MHSCKEKCSCEDSCCGCPICFREEWTAGSIYRPGDAVPFDGSSYAAIHWNQNDPPPSPNWALIAAKGDTGPVGPQGPTGPQGVAGPEGPAGESGFNQVFTTFPENEVEFGTGGADFATLHLPPGDYLIWATVPITVLDSDPQSWSIDLSASSGATITGGASGRIPPCDGGHTQVVPVLGFCHAPAGTIITFRGFGFHILMFPDPKKYMIVATQIRKF